MPRSKARQDSARDPSCRCAAQVAYGDLWGNVRLAAHSGRIKNALTVLVHQRNFSSWPKPSIRGKQQFGRFRGEADIQRAALTVTRPPGRN